MVDVLKNVTDVLVSPATKKRKFTLAVPETMQEAAMSDLEDEGTYRQESQCCGYSWADFGGFCPGPILAKFGREAESPPPSQISGRLVQIEDLIYPDI